MPRSYKSFPRVFVGDALAEGATVELDRDHANHLVNVLRLKEGDSVVLFNGRDGAWLSKLASAGRAAPGGDARQGPDASRPSRWPTNS